MKREGLKEGKVEQVILVGFLWLAAPLAVLATGTAGLSGIRRQGGRRGQSDRIVVPQEPIRWWRFRDGRWRYVPRHDGVLPHRYAEFPLIGMQMSPVDFVGSLAWKSYDPAKWNSAGTGPIPYQLAYRSKLIERGSPLTGGG